MKKRKYQLNVTFDDEAMEALAELQTWLERAFPNLKGKVNKTGACSTAVVALRDIAKNPVCLRGLGELGSVLSITGPGAEMLWRVADAFIRPYEEHPETSPGMGEGLRTGDGFAFLLAQGLHALREKMEREKVVFVLPSQMTPEERKTLGYGNLH